MTQILNKGKKILRINLKNKNGLNEVKKINNYENNKVISFNWSDEYCPSGNPWLNQDIKQLSKL